MSVILTVNGAAYNYPERGDTAWGPDATDWASAVTSGMLQKAGGTFSLTADAYFGATYGLKSVYFKTNTSNVAAAGQFRLARTDTVSWRNQANSADLALTVNSSDELTYNGVTLVRATGIINADISASAAIDWSKMANLTVSRALVSDGSGDVSVSATISTELGYVSGVTSAIQTQMNLKAPLASPTFTGTVIIAGDLTINGTTTTVNTTNLDVTDKNIKVNFGGNDAASEGAGLTVARTGTAGSLIYADAAASKFKIGALGAEVDVVSISATQTLTNKTLTSPVISNLTASRAVVSDGSNVLTSSATTSTELGYVNGVTSAIQTQLGTKQAIMVVTTPGAYPYTATANIIVLVDTASARTVTLPSPVLNTVVIIKDAVGSAGTNNITVARNGSEQIEGVAASRVLASNWGSWSFVSNGTNWFMI